MPSVLVASRQDIEGTVSGHCIRLDPMELYDMFYGNITIVVKIMRPSNPHQCSDSMQGMGQGGGGAGPSMAERTPFRAFRIWSPFLRRLDMILCIYRYSHNTLTLTCSMKEYGRAPMLCVRLCLDFSRSCRHMSLKSGSGVIDNLKRQVNARMSRLRRIAVCQYVVNRSNVKVQSGSVSL